MKLVSRSGWGAAPPRGSYGTVSSTRGVKVHYTGGYVNPRIVDDHAICVKLVKSFQAMHMSGGREQPYMDLGYNLVGCPHRQVFMGRGPGHIPAANGAGLNTAHYAVLGLVGSSGFVTPNDDLLHAIRDGIEYLRQKGGAGSEIKGHRDGFSTSCPGGPLYAWVKRGAPRPKDDSTPVKPEPVNPTEVAVKKLPTLRIGDGKDGKDPIRWHVKTMHYLLLARDYGGLDGLNDTVFSEEHENGVKGLQDAAGMKPTGVVDDATWALLLRVA
ncbi:peptidoglycan recognition protein family protein [Streptosporangium vulgare]|uniref:N-acetylmuramoyl-L-alanine amidase n=1 Tax=Streptosporangium vulgare TaxID=46190 RepID=A0ABV5TQ11_9ACTN